MRYVVLTSLFCFLTSGCAARDLSAIRGEVRNDPVEEEMLWQQARQAEKAIDARAHICKAPALTAYLAEVVRKLQVQEAPGNFSFRVVVLEDPCPEAFSFPNGVIYIHTGMLAQAESEAQLAFVLAHEMSHCTSRHALKALRYAREHDSPDGVSSLTEANLSVALQSGWQASSLHDFRQQLEAEADLAALDLLAKAGYDPIDAVGLLLRQQELRGQIQTMSLCADSYPDIEERLKRCQAFVKSLLPGSRPARPMDREKFLRHTRGALLTNAEIYLQAGRFESARQYAERYLNFAPDDARGYYLLGEVCRQRGEGDDLTTAGQYYEKAIGLDPDFPEPYKAIGLLYYKNGRYCLARNAFARYLALAPTATDKNYIVEYLQQCSE